MDDSLRFARGDDHDLQESTRSIRSEDEHPSLAVLAVFETGQRVSDGMESIFLRYAVLPGARSELHGVIMMLTGYVSIMMTSSREVSERVKAGKERCCQPRSPDPSTAFNEISSESSALRSRSIASDENAPRS